MDILPHEPDRMPSFYGLEADARHDSGEPTDEQIEILAAANGLYNLVGKYGAARVYRWLRTAAHLHGQDLPAAKAEAGVL